MDVLRGSPHYQMHDTQGATMSGVRRSRPRPLRGDSPKPTVSIVVPCYNYGRFLPSCVESCVGQIDVDVDVIVVDDASTDGSDSIAAALAAHDDRVQVVQHERNHGHIATYNDGLERVTGDYIVLLSADDLLVPGALSRAVSLMETWPTVGLVYGHPLLFEDRLPVPRTVARSWTIWRGAEWIAKQSRRATSIIYSPEAVVRADVQREVGGYRSDLPHTGDMEMWLRVAAVADIGRVNGADQAFRREHPASMMATTFAGELVDLEERRRAFDEFFNGPGHDIPGGGQAQAVAHQALARQALELACVLDGKGAAQSVAELVAFARDVFPGFERLRVWRELEWRRRVASDGEAFAALRRGVYDVKRDIEGRVRWRRWYWSGV